jgi:inositol phosphorylceramide mannosyltransferase catalytic subunit
MIQKNIHQTIPDIKKLSPELLKNIDYIKANNPTWSYKLYEDEEVWSYLESHLPQKDVAALKNINPKYGVVIADVFRYVVVHSEGGVYLDIKSTCIKKLDDIIRQDDAYLISQWQNRLGEIHAGAGFYPELARVPGGELQQWHVISESRHPFLEEVINRVLFNIKHYNKTLMGTGKIGVLRLSGPIIYTQTIFNMIGKYSCRIINSRDQGLIYSIYEEMGKRGHHTLTNTHYSKQNEPIVFG